MNEWLYADQAAPLNQQFKWVIFTAPLQWLAFWSDLRHYQRRDPLRLQTVSTAKRAAGPPAWPRENKAGSDLHDPNQLKRGPKEQMTEPVAEVSCQECQAGSNAARFTAIYQHRVFMENARRKTSLQETPQKAEMEGFHLKSLAGIEKSHGAWSLATDLQQAAAASHCTDGNAPCGP